MLELNTSNPKRIMYHVTLPHPTLWYVEAAMVFIFNGELLIRYAEQLTEFDGTKSNQKKLQLYCTHLARSETDPRGYKGCSWPKILYYHAVFWKKNCPNNRFPPPSPRLENPGSATAGLAYCIPNQVRGWQGL